MIRMWKKDFVGLIETPAVSVVSKAGPEKKTTNKRLGQGKERPSSLSSFP